MKTIWIINQYASTPEVGIGGRHFYLARELARKGYIVYVIASSSHHLLHQSIKFDEPFKLEKFEGVHYVWVKMPSYAEAHSKQRVLNWFLFSWRLLKLPLIITSTPDVVLCSSPAPIAFLGAKRLALRFKASLVFEVRDIWPLTLIEIGGHSKKHPLIRFMQWVEDKAYRDADRVVSNLKNAVEHMVDHGMAKEKFAWIPNGFSLDEVMLNSPLNHQAEIMLPLGKFLIGYTGSLGVVNALDTLILAAEQLQDLPHIAFVLVGDGKEKKALKSLVMERGLNNIIFIDPIPKIQIQAMLARFDACFIGAYKQPLYRFGVSPNKLYDYFYAGKPIIYAIESGVYTPVAEAQAGMQVPAGDATALAAAIRSLYFLPKEVRDQMGVNGRKAAVSQYEYGQLAMRLEKVLFDEKNETSS